MSFHSRFTYSSSSSEPGNDMTYNALDCSSHWPEYVLKERWRACIDMSKSKGQTDVSSVVATVQVIVKGSFFVNTLKQERFYFAKV